MKNTIVDYKRKEDLWRFKFNNWINDEIINRFANLLND